MFHGYLDMNNDLPLIYKQVLKRKHRLFCKKRNGYYLVETIGPGDGITPTIMVLRHGYKFLLWEDDPND